MKYFIWVDGRQVLEKPMYYDFCKVWVDNYKLTKDKMNIFNFEEIYIINEKYKLEVKN